MPAKKMPGTLSWSIGYFSKIKITEDQLKAQDYTERENDLICSSPPDTGFPSGILAIQIHNITGLEVEALQKTDKDGEGDKEDEAEQSDDLPSSYCTIILDHKCIYTTRTKPKNAKPFFKAGTETFIRDWRNSEVMVSVRDSRERENDALLGIVYLPLAKSFEKRSQVMDMYPLVGGVGFGRARISMVFRSVELQLPRELLGWDYGTLQISAPIKSRNVLPDALNRYRLKLRSNMARATMMAETGEWRPKHGKDSLFLPVRKRYATPLVIEFRKSSLGLDSTPAFAIFWLREIPDEEERTIVMQVWKGGKENLKRATTSAGYEGLHADHSLGDIEFTMKFWRGLSGYHKRQAQKAKNPGMHHVIEVLDTVNDEIEGKSDQEQISDDSTESDYSSGEDRESPLQGERLKPHTNQDSDEEFENEDSNNSTLNPTKKIKGLTKNLINSHNDSEDGSRGPVAQLRDYNAHFKQLHRKHRGIMQWRAARTANWTLDKARRMKSQASDLFEVRC
ncbi:hypothetical protein BP6252_11071 [Coleophoma cylindrospora]|uniref:C2 domain-containing protein n=1 Tax=Coleophoma cylindrospora TaxID=1849047 RepID=A0A3D8QNW9_9HELO|nr:hypothetical protein BP6252_11071 [Coleophoma cylindrospora]